MIFVRNEAQPSTWNGTTFRSVTERNVAQELTKLGVRYSYEPEVFRELRYLPDFRIESTPDPEMGQARWIEVKPAQAIYAVRDHFGLPERFSEPSARRMAAEDLAEVAPELMKPKALAEHTGDAVLVASAVNRNSTVALVMYEQFIEVTRSYPLVNWQQVVRDRERAERHRRWRLEQERRDAERAAENQRIAQHNLGQILRADRIQAKYPGVCCVCQQRRPAESLVVARIGERWIPCCNSHTLVPGGKAP